MKYLFSLIAAAALAGCVQYNVSKSDGVGRARIGQSVSVGNFEVTPLEVIEDSRCAEGVQCVWAGRLKLRARIDFNDRIATRELTLGEPQPIGTGTLELVEANPHPERGKTIYPEDYRFGFTYTPNAKR